MYTYYSVYSPDKYIFDLKTILELLKITIISTLYMYLYNIYLVYMGIYACIYVYCICFLSK